VLWADWESETYYIDCDVEDGPGAERHFGTLWKGMEGWIWACS